MVATRKKSGFTPLDEPSATTDSADADSVEDTRNYQARSEGLSPLSVHRASTSSADLDSVRVWPLCFAIAIEKSQRIRPGIMVGASSLLAGVTYHLQESDAELLPSALILSPLVVFTLVEAATLSAAFFILLPRTMAQAYRDDKNTTLKVADSAVLSALPPAVARFAVGSGIAWQRVILAVVRDGALFMTLYLLCVALLLVGGENDAELAADLENAHGADGARGEGDYLGGGGGGAGDAGEAGGWQEMDGGISVRNIVGQ